MENPLLGDLINSFNRFDSFKLFSYYITSFGSLPSTLKTVLPVERSRENVEKVLQRIDLERFGFEPVFKHWITDDFQNADRADDYAYKYVFRSERGRMLIQFSALHSVVDIDFLYDIKDAESEAWLLETNHQLRGHFGIPKAPKFKVLVAQDGMFGTEDVNTGDFASVDINELYNDDFAEIDGIITSSLNKKESGIILLHGEPGTGKTTYIKNLICKFKDKEFIFIQNDFVRDLLKPSFVTFLLNHKNAVLIIEDAEKVVVAREDSSDASVVSTILQLTDGLFSDFLNIKILCTFNTDIAHIDKALLRKGRMIAKYEFKALSPEKTAALAKKLGHENLSGSMTLADIFEHDKHEFKNPEKKRIGFFPA